MRKWASIVLLWWAFWQWQPEAFTSKTTLVWGPFQTQEECQEKAAMFKIRTGVFTFVGCRQMNDDAGWTVGR